MEVLSTKQIGWILIGFSVVLFIVLTLTVNEILALQSLPHQSCPLPDAICPFKTNVPIPTVVGYIVDLALGAFGAFLILAKEKIEKITTESQQKWKKVVKTLSGEDKLLYELVGNSGGFLFQNELVEKSGMNKVRVSRILDKLEAKGLIERKRRGMSNIVVLKN
jgi:uncharacterized membrane protein